jgi:hypothetical protein
MTITIKVAIATVASSKVVDISGMDQKLQKELRTSQPPASAGRNVAY